MEKVLIVSTKEPGVTKSVTPVFADILVKLGRYRRVDVSVKVPEAHTTADSPAKQPRKKRQYRRRDMRAEE